MKVTLLSPALREILHAIEYYDGQRTGLGAALDDDLSQTLQLIARHPSAGAPHERGTRRVLLRGFPYDVVYLPLDDRVVVVAFAHQHRRTWTTQAMRSPAFNMAVTSVHDKRTL